MKAGSSHRGIHLLPLAFSDPQSLEQHCSVVLVKEGGQREPVASGGPLGPCFIVLGVCDRMPGLLHKENCGGRKKTAPQAHPMAPPPGPQSRRGESSLGGCGLSVSISSVLISPH